MNRKLIYLNFAVVALLVLCLAYFVFQNQKITSSFKSDEQTISASPQQIIKENPNKSPVASPKQLTMSDTEQAILKYTNNTDRNALKDFLAENVDVTLYSSDCCQPMTKDDAIKQLSYINEGLPLTFDQKNTTVVNLKAKNPNLSGTFLGISQTKEHMAAFTIDGSTNKITKIELSVSWKLYNQ